jgi:hypothetical protein
MLGISRTWLAALWLGVVGALVAGPGLAADTGNGSKNFRTPTTVPNYFSNEAGPMIGGTAETQRGPLYPAQTASSPAPVQQVPAYYAAEPRPRQHIAMAVPHGRWVRGRYNARYNAPAAHHVSVHGRRGTYRVEARSVGRIHSVSAGRTSRTISRSAHVTSMHRHARG